jgi:hypothetical protein
MVVSLASTLDVAVPAPPPTLLAPRAYARARELASRFPAALAHWVYLECRLVSGDRIDLSLAIDATEASLLATADLGRHPAWAHLKSFGQGWTRGAIDRVWLEFDIDRAAQRPLVPNVFFELASGTDVASAAVRLRGPHTDDALLARCVEQLPAGARVPYLGVFTSRGRAGLRLCIAGMSDAALPAYLDAIGWRGSPTTLGCELDRLRAMHAPGAGIVDIHIDGGISDAIGLEYVCRRDTQARRALAESPFVDSLVARGLCTSERAQALAHWPRSCYAVMPHELWESVLHRRLNHIKVTFADNALCEAKAYLSIGYWPRRRASIE